MEQDFVIVGRKFTFEAAHRLPRHPGKCATYHGHTYTVIVEIGGTPDPETGMVVDFYDLKLIVNEYIEHLDHKDLTEVLPSMSCTTVENLVRWFADNIATHFRRIYTIIVQIQEGEGGYARYDTFGKCP